MVETRPRTYVKVGVTTDQIKYIARSASLSYNQLLERIQSFLNDVWKTLEIEIKLWIDKYVPKRTGQLRNNIKRALEQSYLKLGILRIVLGIIGLSTGYVERVNKMGTMRVRHSGEIGYVYYPNPDGDPPNQRGRVILWDPQAIGNFWENLITYVKDIAITTIARKKDEYFGMPGVANRMIRRKVNI